jgi:hypothetical protein
MWLRPGEKPAWLLHGLRVFEASRKADKLEHNPRRMPAKKRYHVRQVTEA